MLFNSIDFAFFLPIVFLLYWFVAQRNLKFQNCLILAASYFFYGCWDWRFLFLIITSTTVDYLVGLGLLNQKDTRKKKWLLFVSIAVNLGLLGFFKYYNFFIANFTSVFSFFGREISNRSLNIILPVGISFYTFQTLSYSFDIYRKKIKPTKDFIAFSAFVSFFPQLVAGPIERASHLLPQFYTKRRFNYTKAVDGMRQILWGLFKKVVIADNCAEIADQIFNHSEDYGGLILVLGAVFFTFQIYGDFSGYSDIAIGTSRLFGVNLTRNFSFPYFSRDIAEFWRRWHISLSTWFRDYIYIPLGGSRGNIWMKIRNTFIIFILSGFWHGANWTFIAWGVLNAIYFLPLLLTKKNRNHIDIVARGKIFPSMKELFFMLTTFTLTLFAWIFFRAESIAHAIQYISNIFSQPASYISLDNYMEYKVMLLLILVFLLIEWIGREQEYAIAKLDSKYNRVLRHSIYYAIAIAIFWFGGKEQEFIYFQF